MRRNVGSFQVTSDKLMVTDPCYQRDTWCQGIVKNARKGKWFGFVTVRNVGTTERELRCVEVEARHEDLFKNAELTWKKTRIHVGVNSGQAGIFDEACYPQGEVGDYGDEGSFYGRACEATLGEPYEKMQRLWSELTYLKADNSFDHTLARIKGLPAPDNADKIAKLEVALEEAHKNDPMGGVIAEGVVSRSGYGDGGYECYVAREGRRVVAVKVVFIGED